jgi:hypothetical protein
MLPSVYGSCNQQGGSIGVPFVLNTITLSSATTGGTHVSTGDAVAFTNPPIISGMFGIPVEDFQLTLNLTFDAGSYTQGQTFSAFTVEFGGGAMGFMEGGVPTVGVNLGCYELSDTGTIDIDVLVIAATPAPPCSGRPTLVWFGAPDGVMTCTVDMETLDDFGQPQTLNLTTAATAVNQIL